MRLGAALLASLLGTSVFARELTEPRPLPDNPGPKYPKTARREGLSGPVAFLAKVSAEGRVTSLRILRVPEARYGFEKATREAVMRWRFEPARHDGEPVAGLFAGTVDFRLRPKDETAIAELVRAAFDRWKHPGEVGPSERAPRIDIRREAATPSSVLEARLADSFEMLRATAESLSVDAIRFEGDDAWVTTTLRLPSEAKVLPFRTLVVRRSRRWYAFLSEIPNDPGAAATEPETYDVDPVPLARPNAPRYPARAREERVSGSVVLQVQVELDGSTTVLRAVDSLPFCMVPAIENAWGWRWKPALDDGKPVPAVGLITISFDLLANP
jgi:protein TonB